MSYVIRYRLFVPDLLACFIRVTTIMIAGLEHATLYTSIVDRGIVAAPWRMAAVWVCQFVCHGRAAPSACTCLIYLG